MAEHISMNPSYFSTYFKKITGRKFIDCLTEIRIKKAAELIKSGDINIVDICSMVGYKNITHFYNIFKQHYKITPAEFRNIHTKG